MGMEFVHFRKSFDNPEDASNYLEMFRQNSKDFLKILRRDDMVNSKLIKHLNRRLQSLYLSPEDFFRQYSSFGDGFLDLQRTFADCLINISPSSHFFIQGLSKIDFQNPSKTNLSLYLERDFSVKSNDFTLPGFKAMRICSNFSGEGYKQKEKPHNLFYLPHEDIYVEKHIEIVNSFFGQKN